MNYFYKEKNVEYKKVYSELLRSICIINFNYLAIGKMNGELSIYDIKNKKEIYNRRIFDKAITYLIRNENEKEDSNLISCSEDSIIEFLKLETIDDDKLTMKIKKMIKSKHNSSIKKLEYLGNYNFASCSKDKTFIIWNENTKKNNLVIKDNYGIENFFLEKKKGLVNNIIFLNEKGCLSFYKYEKKKRQYILKKLIFNIDYTNSNSMIKIDNNIFIGGYNFLQIISLKTMQIETIIHINNPITYLYNFKNKSLILGQKNGELKFINIVNSKFNILYKEKVNDWLNSIDFNFTNLFNKENKIELFNNLPIISFLIEYGKIFCISDEIFKVFNNEKSNNKFYNCFFPF